MTEIEPAAQPDPLARDVASDVLTAGRANTSEALAVREERAPAIYADVTRVPGERLPIIPPYLRGRQEIRATITVVGGQQWHRARYHGVRLPLYLFAALACAVVGLARLIRRQVAWWWLMESHELRSEAAAAGDTREWMKLHKEARAVRKVRGGILAAELAAVVLAAAVLVRYAPRWSLWIVAAAAALVLARLGRPAGRPIVSRAIIAPQYEPPTHEIITRALGSLGIPQVSQAVKEGGPGIRFVSDVMRDGPGWACHLDLPHGVSVSDILARREALASGLRRPLSATWPEGVPAEHPGRMNLWVGFSDISKAKPPAWPLLKARSTDVFASVPFGCDPRGRVVEVPLFEVNWLIGSMPGQGKTACVRGLACCVALDVRAEMWIHELAGKGDIEPLAKICHRYCSGLDDEAIAYAAASLRMLRAELDRRSAALKKLPKESRPEGKITPEMAARRHLRLYPLVAFFDEVQNLFMHPEHGAQAQDDAGYVIRVGRAYGIVLVLATQRPDAKSVPTAVTGNIGCRFCLQVPGQVEVDLILGTSSYKNGFNPAAFRPKIDAGLGWLKADGPAQIVRTFKVDLPEAEKIAARARDMRDRAGVLTGYALGEAEVTAARDVLADVLAVFGADNGLQWDDVAERLAARWPDRWADVTGEAVSAQCRAHGVPSVNVNSGGQVRKGCRRVAIEREASR